MKPWKSQVRSSCNYRDSRIMRLSNLAPILKYLNYYITFPRKYPWKLNIIAETKLIPWSKQSFLSFLMYTWEAHFNFKEPLPTTHELHFVMAWSSLSVQGFFFIHREKITVSISWVVCSLYLMRNCADFSNKEGIESFS